MMEGGKTRLAEDSFIRYDRKLWNQALTKIKEAQAIGAAKTESELIAKHYQSKSSVIN